MPNTVAESQITLARALDDTRVSVPAELDGLVRLARTLAALPDPEIDPAFVARLEARLLTEGMEQAPARRLVAVASQAPDPVAPQSEPRTTAAVIALPRRRFVVRRSLVAAVAAAMLVALPVAASASALPGTPLYGLKNGIESLELVMTRGPVADGFVHLKHANRRLEEAGQLVTIGKPDLVPDTLARMERSLRSGAELILDNATDAAILKRLARELSRSRGRLSVMLTRAPAGVHPAIINALVSARALSQVVQQALAPHAPPAIPTAKPQTPDQNASWLDDLDASLADDAIVGGANPSNPGPPAVGNPKPDDRTQRYDGENTSSSCRQRSYVGPGGDLVHSTCEVDVTATIDEKAPELS